ncbi:hypothetical protein CANCADRAFT_15907, partial [Tortispora caseinolytica NRRL Y-17796]
SLLDDVVPPINVLIVEDNVVNRKILEAFLSKRGIKYSSASDGKEAVETWRCGGFHLILMDIQLPVMSGIDASKEIRRLERVNNVGQSLTGAIMGNKDIPKEDRLDRDVFRSPVIIVALTASSLQSDKEEALAAGCNDFLTKPVSFTWLARKISEWGCMQALIDFDGWR